MGPKSGSRMHIKFTGKIEIEKTTGDLQLTAYHGDMPIRCIVKREAVVTGFQESCMPDNQILDLYYARRSEIHGAVAQRYANGERQPTVSRIGMSTH